MKLATTRLAAAFVAAGALTAPAYAQQLTIGLKSEATSMDPQFHNLSTNTQVLLNVFEGLTKQDAVQRLEPSLATEWEAVDDTTWRFTLREGVKFHNGSDFTARDVIYTMCRVPLVENSPSSYTIYTGTMTDVAADGDHAVIITTDGPDPLLPTELASLPILSADALGAEDEVTYAQGGCEGMGEVPQSPAFNSPDVAVGTGPYTLDEFTRGNQLVMSRFEGYWGDAPNWERVVMRPISSDGPRVAALLSGDVDMIESPPIQDIPRIEQGGFKIVDALSNRIIYLAMDQEGEAPSLGGTNGENPLLDQKVRQAISLAINREAIAERIMGGFAVPAGELLPPPMFGTSDRDVDPYDPERAKELLAEAGYPDGFQITLGTPNDRYINDEQVAQAVAQMLARVGIQTTVDAMTASQFFSRRNAQEFPIYLAGWGAASGEMSSPLKSLLATYDKDAGMGVTNAGRYSNAEFDEILREAMTTIDDAERETLLQQAGTIALDEFGIIPLHYEQTVWAMKPELSYEPRVDQYTIASQVESSGEGSN
ncbi:ABC transporter substrate-binding protein [Lutibaculum baratangense]|uniref:Oligopeptide ABC transporter, periplasmic oligopeptide-binding protein OppA n=1 Tax=Lutibaculum baratangense AMV1 TaxID=631454 RepID=V4RJS2_9HYPH|nr:ABC transporter substrate-binding protein [Lutibaculum baratangense]ESR25574.1 Oligopeptide ABC transporter, periplasmic oligopeptide-binding protein OppA [Lutibaculum baratangense AMV1]